MWFSLISLLHRFIGCIRTMRNSFLILIFNAVSDENHLIVPGTGLEPAHHY